MNTSNPTLSTDTFSREPFARTDEAMTIRGTANKTLALLALATVAASFTW
jgi:hypothetical protein